MLTGALSDLLPAASPQSPPQGEATPTPSTGGTTTGVLDDLLPKASTQPTAPQPVKTSTGVLDDLLPKPPEIGSIPHPSFWPSIQKSAATLGVDPEHLWRAMHFESGGNPSNVNPQSGATGLIQFMPSTARGLGTSTDALRRMTPEEQMPFVEKYLQQNGVKPGANFSDLYSAILWPKAVGQPGDTVLFRKGTAAYAQNAALDTGNKGYVTKNDAAQHAWGPYKSTNPIELPPWEQGVQQPQPASVVNTTTGQTTDLTTPTDRGPLAPSHDQNVLANLKALPFDVEKYILSVKGGDGGVDPKGGTDTPSNRIATVKAAEQIAQAMGYRVGLQTDTSGKPVLDKNGQYVYDNSAAQNFLDPKNPAFKSLQHVYANPVGVTPDDPSLAWNQALRQAVPNPGQFESDPANVGAGAIRGVVHELGDKGLTKMPAVAGVPLMMGNIPLHFAESIRTMLGDENAFTANEPQKDQIANFVTDLAFQSLVGGAAGGGGAAAGATRLLPAVAKNIIGVLGFQLGASLPDVIKNAYQLSAEDPSLTPMQALAKSSGAAGQALLKAIDPRTEFDQSLSPSERISAATMQALLLAGVGGHVLGHVGEGAANVDKFSQIDPPKPPPFKFTGEERPAPIPEQPLPQIQPNESSQPSSMAPFLQRTPEPVPQEAGMPGHVMVSPNTEEGLTYDQAAQKLTTPEQVQGRETANKIAQSRGMRGEGFSDAIGDWGGAENTLIGRFDPSHTLPELRAVAAESGKALDQIDSLAIKPNPEGPHMLATFDFPASNYSEAQVRQILTDNNFGERTIQSDPDTIRATIFKENPTQEFADNVRSVKSYDGVRSIVSPAEGGFVTGLGPDAGREQAGPIYDQILKANGEGAERGSGGAGQTPEASAPGRSSDFGSTPRPAESGRTPGAAAAIPAEPARATEPNPNAGTQAQRTELGPERPTTGIRKSISDAEAKDRGIQLKDQQPYTTPSEAHAAGREAIERGLVDPLQVARDVSAKPRQLTPTEVGAFEAKHVDLLRQENEVNAELSKTKVGTPDAEMLSARLRQLLDDHAVLQDGIRKGRRENSAGLASFKMMSNLDDGTYAGARSLAEKLKGEPLTAKEDSAIRALQSKLDEANRKTSEVQKQLQDKHDQLTEFMAKKQLEAERRVQRQVTRGEIQQAKAAAIDRIQRAVKSAPIGATPFEALPEFMGGLKDLAVAHIREGALTLGDAYDRVSKQLEEKGIQITMRQFNQALAGMYETGEAKTPTEAQQRVQELRGQARLLTQINDAIEGKGPERGEKTIPSATIQGMREALKSIVDSQGLRPPTDPSVRLNKAIEDALDVLEHGPAEKETSTPDTSEVAALKNRLQSIRDQIKAKYGDDPETTRLKALEKATADKLGQVQGQYRPVKGQPVKSDAIDAAQKKMNDASAQVRIQDQVFELQRQIRERDFPGPKPKVEVQPSSELQKLQQQKMLLEAQRDQLVRSMAKVTPADFLLKLYRASMLSGTSILGKMAATTGGYMASTPIEDIAGSGVNAVRSILRLPNLQSPTERIVSPQAYVAGAQDFFKSIADGDLKQKFQTSLGKLDVEAAARGDAHGKEFTEQPSALNFFQRIHGALHTPVMRYAYTVETTKLIQTLSKAGVDVSNPRILDAVNAQGYARALQAGLINDNQLSTLLSKTFAGWAHQGTLGKASSTVGKFIVPFAKVGANVAGRQLEYAGGIPYAAALDAHNAISGVGAKLPPEQAAAIQRAYARGSVGAALMALGAAGYKNGLIKGGGLYDPERRGKPINGQEYDSLTIDGWKVPHFLMDHPYFKMIQFGLTIGQVGQGVGASGKGRISAGETVGRIGNNVVESIPGLESGQSLLKLLEGDGSASTLLGREAASAVPAGLQDIARYGDRKAGGHGLEALMPGILGGSDVRKVDDKGFVPSLMATVPGARNSLPNKKMK